MKPSDQSIKTCSFCFHRRLLLVLRQRRNEVLEKKERRL